VRKYNLSAYILQEHSKFWNQCWAACSLSRSPFIERRNMSKRYGCHVISINQYDIYRRIYWITILI